MEGTMNKNRNTSLNKIKNATLCKVKTISLRLVVIVIAFVSTLLTYYTINMKKVSNDNTLKEVTIKEGTINSVATTLKEEHLIKNITIFKVYTRISGKTNLKAGTYDLSENMGVKKIVKCLEKGYCSSGNNITFKEGTNIRKIAKIVDEKTNNSYEDFMKLMNDNEYIDSLINEYWFLTNDIKNSNIYYPLEGYLYPDTYSISKDTDIKTIVKTMLNETDKKLSKYKDGIESSNLSLHELITVASIVELEVANSNDRKAVAEIIYNRLNSDYFPTMGMDTTAYYGAKIDDWKNNKLSSSELNDCSNKYNTRCNVNTGLPVGPICSPSIESVEAAINPDSHNYYYFVNDCDGKLYMSKTDTEHNNIINKLIRENKWCA